MHLAGMPVHRGQQLRRLGQRVGLPGAGELRHLDDVMRDADGVEAGDELVGPAAIVGREPAAHDPGGGHGATPAVEKLPPELPPDR